MNDEQLVVSVSEFVALLNQTFDFAFPFIRVSGEVSEYKISKNKWVYFNLVDQESSIRVFGTVYQIKQVIEDGMRVVVHGTPRMHNRYGFSLNMHTVTPSGEGSIKRAFELMYKKLAAEGLFDEGRKRPLPQYPQRIGLITSSQAAAYSDFMKIVDQRWAGLEIRLADVTVQGESASGQIARAIEYFAAEAQPVDVLVITRGGGSGEDLMAFSTEQVARAVAASRIPTLVGVGHEIDTSLADLAADVRATTPTNAAQLLVPDKAAILQELDGKVAWMHQCAVKRIEKAGDSTKHIALVLDRRIGHLLTRLTYSEEHIVGRLDAYMNRLAMQVEAAEKQLRLVDPQQILRRGYAIVRRGGKVVKSAAELELKTKVMVQFTDRTATMEVVDVDS